jgi:hypothetical protein
VLVYQGLSTKFLKGTFKLAQEKTKMTFYIGLSTKLLKGTFKLVHEKPKMTHLVVAYRVLVYQGLSKLSSC